MSLQIEALSPIMWTIIIAVALVLIAAVVFTWKSSAMSTRKMVTIAMLTAVYVVLNFAGTVRLGWINISVASLPVIVGAMLYGPVGGLLVGLLGAFMGQLLTYGVTATTILWILPQAARGLLVGVYAKHCGYKFSSGQLTLALIGTALVVTALNTGAMYIDSVIYNYYSYAYVFGGLVVRIISGAATAVLMVFVAPPVVNLLNRSLDTVRTAAGSFEHALMKAVSSTELGLDTMTLPELESLTTEEVIARLPRQDSERAFVVYECLKRGVDHKVIYDVTKIDWWFLDKMQHLANLELGLKNGPLTREKYLEAKHYGFLDKTILRLSGAEKLPMDNYVCGFKMVDTCAAEFAAKTPYFYSTCDKENEAEQFINAHKTSKKKILVFGSGPIRIGQGIEFDYCSVHAVWTLKKHGCEAILVNNNPETVSTDFDTGDRLYFDPLNPESVDHIIAAEKPDGCLVQFGGQTAIKLAKHMDEIGLPIYGTPADAIDEAEDRERFDELLERCGIPRPAGRTVFTLDEALQAAQEVGYPVLMRPSYVLGGQNMIVAYNSSDVIEYMGVITKHVDMSHPVLMDKYIYGTECEVDAICDGTDYLVPGIMEQIERTGVHSGDSICVYPPYNFPQDVIDTLVDYTGRFARELKVVGLVNVQYAVQDGKVYVIEVNPRSSRTVPYISKVTGVPMVDLAVRCTLGEKLKDMGYGTGLWRNGKSPYVAVKVPVYSFLKLHGVDTMLGPEMKSTGEVLGIAPNMHEALIKGLVAAGYQFKTPGPGSCVIISVKDSDKKEAAELAWKLHDYGYKIYGTPGTARYLNSQMVPCSTVRQMSEERPNVLDLLESGLVDYIISTSPHGRDPHRDSVKFRRKATELSIPCITALDTARILVNALRSDHDISGMELVDIATLHRDAANGK